MTVDSDPQLLNITHNVISDGVNDALMSFTFNLLAKLENTLMYIQVNVPEDKQDEKYRKDLFKTRIDLKKMLDGVNSNFITKSIMEKFQESLEFEMKYPMVPVSAFWVRLFSVHQICHDFPGHLSAHQLFGLRQIHACEWKRQSFDELQIHR